MINTTSARVAIAVATSNGQRSPEWLEDVVQHSGKGDTIPAILHGLDAGRVLAAVDACREPIRHWLLLCYGAEGYAPTRSLHVVTSALYSEHARVRTIRMEPARAANLAGAVVADMRARYRTPHMEPAEPRHFAKAADRQANRARDIMSAVRAMQNVIDTWDGEGLGRVASSLPHILRSIA